MKWIDKSVRMPKDGQKVEVLGDDGKIRSAEGCQAGRVKGFLVAGVQDLIDGTHLYEVTHWRPARTGLSLSR